MLRADKDFLKKPVHFYKQKKRTNHTIFFKPYKTVKFSWKNVHNSTIFEKTRTFSRKKRTVKYIFFLTVNQKILNIFIIFMHRLLN